MPPLPDVILRILPSPSWWPESAPDITLHSFILVSFVACCISARLNRSDCIFVMIYMRRLFWLYGLCFLLRLLTLGGTTLPSSLENCPFFRRNLWEYLTAGPLILMGQVDTCTDKLFSGHTSLATLTTWFWMSTFWTKSSFSTKLLVRTYAFLHGSSVFIASLMSRKHYTVDVVLAIIISTLVFHTYHLIIWVQEGYHRGFPYFAVRYGGGPSKVCKDIESKENALNDSSDTDSTQIGNARVRRAPRAARIAFSTVVWMEGLDLRAPSEADS